MLSVLQIRLSLVQIRSISGVFCSVVGVTLIALETLRHSLLYQYIQCIHLTEAAEVKKTETQLFGLFI